MATQIVLMIGTDHYWTNLHLLQTSRIPSGRFDFTYRMRSDHRWVISLSVSLYSVSHHQQGNKLPLAVGAVAAFVAVGLYWYFGSKKLSKIDVLRLRVRSVFRDVLQVHFSTCTLFRGWCKLSYLLSHYYSPCVYVQRNPTSAAYLLANSAEDRHSRQNLQALQLSFVTIDTYTPDFDVSIFFIPIFAE